MKNEVKTFVQNQGTVSFASHAPPVPSIQSHTQKDTDTDARTDGQIDR